MQAIQTLSMTQPEDDRLARQAVHNPDAFAELYERHFVKVYRYHLAHSGDASEAQDLTSQTWMAALEGIPGYRGTGSFSAWLLGIARRKQALHFRQRRPQAGLDTAQELADPSPSPESQAARRLEVSRISRALGGLAGERADAVVLCLFAGLSAAEASSVMGKSEAAVKMLLLRGLRDLRQRLAPSAEEEQ